MSQDEITPYTFPAYEHDSNEVESVIFEGNTHWHPDTVRMWSEALVKVKKLYPNEYYHRGLHTTKGFNGITVYLKNRVPTEMELNLTEIDGVPIKITVWKLADA